VRWVKCEAQPYQREDEKFEVRGDRVKQTLTHLWGNWAYNTVARELMEEYAALPLTDPAKEEHVRKLNGMYSRVKARQGQEYAVTHDDYGNWIGGNSEPGYAKYGHPLFEALEGIEFWLQQGAVVRMNDDVRLTSSDGGIIGFEDDEDVRRFVNEVEIGQLATPVGE
jgi:hypothetical protein